MSGWWCVTVFSWTAFVALVGFGCGQMVKHEHDHGIGDAIVLLCVALFLPTVVALGALDWQVTHPLFFFREIAP